MKPQKREWSGRSGWCMDAVHDLCPTRFADRTCTCECHANLDLASTIDG